MQKEKTLPLQLQEACSGFPLRFVEASSSSCFSLIDFSMLLEAPFSSDFLVSPRFAESAAPAAFCCALDFAGADRFGAGFFFTVLSAAVRFGCFFFDAATGRFCDEDFLAGVFFRDDFFVAIGWISSPCTKSFVIARSPAL